MRLRMVQTLNTYAAEPGASPDADKLLSFRRYPGGAGELRGWPEQYERSLATIREAASSRRDPLAGECPLQRPEQQRDLPSRARKK
jgi:hypothetical protein